MRTTLFSIVLVTYNRSEFLRQSLKSIFKQNLKYLKAVYILDNCSSDDTQSVINEYKNKFPFLVKNVQLIENTGGAGGFEIGSRLAYNEGSEWIGLIDDDVILAPDCLEQLSLHTVEEKCLIAVREDRNGNLAEYGALRVDYSNPFRLNPKISTISSRYESRRSLPDKVSIDTASFEGFFVHRTVIDSVGFPNHEFFIFGDDTDYSLRIKNSGVRIIAVRDAKITRLLPFTKDTRTNWKQYYRWRNFFLLHFLHGKNLFVRAKPYPIAVASKILFPQLRKICNIFKVLTEARNLANIIRNKNQFDNEILRKIKSNS